MAQVARNLGKEEAFAEGSGGRVHSRFALSSVRWFNTRHTKRATRKDASRLQSNPGYPWLTLLAGGVYLRGCEGAPIQRVVVGAEADHKIWYVCLQVSVPMIKWAVAGRWVKEGLGLGFRAGKAKARRLGGSLAIG